MFYSLKKSLLLGLLVVPVSVFAQSGIEKKYLELTEVYDSSNFETAIPMAEELASDAFDTKNQVVEARANALLALSRYKLRMDPRISVPMFEEVLANIEYIDPKYEPEVYWALAISYTTSGDHHFKHIENHFKESDSLLNAALQIFKQREDVQGVIKTLRGLGFVRGMDDDFPRNLDYKLQAYDLALKHGDPQMRGIVTNIGNLYNQVSRWEETVELMEGLLNQVNSEEIDYNYANVYKILGEAYLNQEQYPQAIANFERAINIVTDERNFVVRMYTYELIAECYYRQKEFDLLQYWINEADIYFEQTNANLPKHYFNLYKGYMEMERGNLKEAERYADLHLARALEDQWEDRISHNNRFRYELYKKWGQHERALSHYEKFQTYKDSTLRSSSSGLFENYKIQLETSKQRADILQLENNVQEKNARLIIISIVSVLLLMVAAFVTQRFRSGKRIAQLKLKNKELENIRIKEELSLQEKQLSDFTLTMIQKNQVINELDENLEEAIGLKNGNVVQSLKKMRRQISQAKSSEESWDEFLKYFGAVHQDFFDKLNKRFGGLSRKELKHCALIKMNMTLKESASIFGISADSVKVARYRLRKKINLDEDTSLYEFLSTI